jgi:ureidoglycolate lyase
MPVTVAHAIELEPLTASAFEPFGRVVAHDGAGRRFHIPSAYSPADEGKPVIWIARVEDASAFPLEIRALERHPHSPQTFIPRGDHPHIVVVAKSDASGAPDPAGIRAFLAQGHQGVVYAQNCWHLGLTPLTTPCEFVVTMLETGQPDETIVHPLACPAFVNG